METLAVDSLEFGKVTKGFFAEATSRIHQFLAGSSPESLTERRNALGRMQAAIIIEKLIELDYVTDATVSDIEGMIINSMNF